ncbi:pyridoxamine 5'-phosphate oxidase [Halobacteriovorax sp. YZS-1-1]|uniref:pyridoxamine 5'-phosphate oxidase n=1 Tax=unclassified Halobacteriovorax TaxID=2639665 RepID=UPI00399ADE16
MSDYKDFIGDFKESPVEIFEKWFQDAQDKEENAPAFILSTVDEHGAPNARTLLLKEVHKGKPLFFTNYNSVKAKEIDGNNNVAMTFYWHRLGKQVRIRGKISKCERDISRNYFQSRAKESQIASLTSKQSESVSSRKNLETEYHENLIRYNNESVPYPENWGGYYVEVNEITFFIYGEHRLNDRFQFVKKGNKWDSLRLYP